MASGSFIAYYRVSTERQGRSGLGLEAQQAAVRSYLNGGEWNLAAEVQEVESGKRSDRPKLDEALRLCRLHRATLIIAKLDRLTRNLGFMTRIMESGVNFIAVDNPNANRLTIHILVAVAENEAQAISDRTRVALAAAKARGTKLGGDRGNLPAVSAQGRVASLEVRRRRAAALRNDVAATLAEIKAEGVLTLSGIAAALNARDIPTARGGKWSAVQVGRIIDRQAA